jgi:hypothetical protein
LDGNGIQLFNFFIEKFLKIKYYIIKMENQKLPEWAIPSYPPLNSMDLVGKASVEGQLVNYPKVVRTMADPPIQNQSIGCISYMLFDEPKKAKGSEKPVYGFMKLRGNWCSQQQATFEASKIIREVDSKYQIRLAPVGVWVPITEDESCIREKTDVRMNDEEVHLRDQVVKEKEAEQRRIQRELQERTEALKTEGDIYDNPTSLKYYSMRMVTELRLIEELDRQQRQIQNVKDNIEKVRKEIAELELKHPSYKEDWIECYNIERRKTGLPDFCPSEDFIQEHSNAIDHIIKNVLQISLEDGEKE